MIYLIAVEEAYQKICYGYSEPDEMRLNGQTANEMHVQDNSKFNNATVIVDRTVPNGEIVFVNNKVKKNPPYPLQENHWMSRVKI
jgi:hypothetical protein